MVMLIQKLNISKVMFIVLCSNLQCPTCPCGPCTDSADSKRVRVDSTWTLHNNCIKWETYLFLFNMGHMIYVLDQFFSVNSMGVSIF